MPVIRVADPTDPRLADYRGLTDVALRSRKEPESGLFMAESIEVIRRAADAGISARSMLMAERWLESMADVIERLGPDLSVFVADADVLRSITGFHLHRGAIAAMRRPVLREVADVVAGARRVVVLEDIVDHTNVGAIFRSVAGLGADAVLVSPRCADPLYRRSVRVSMGTVFQVPWTRLPDWPGGLDTLRGLGFTIAALALEADATTLDSFASDPPDRVALVLGAEGDGLSRRAVQASDVVVRVPMSGGVDSLNVAAASAVALWALRPA
ncbi:MAG: RNA methyltransferase [Actinomycetota bacterium]|nr:RNA methyltransferase [Actinomycetota bacterium]